MDMWERVNAEVQKIALAYFSEEKHVSTPHLYAKTEVQELLKKRKGGEGRIGEYPHPRSR